VSWLLRLLLGEPPGIWRNRGPWRPLARWLTHYWPTSAVTGFPCSGLLQEANTRVLLTSPEP